jgi:hypothetical protein
MEKPGILLPGFFVNAWRENLRNVECGNHNGINNISKAGVDF